MQPKHALLFASLCICTEFSPALGQTDTQTSLYVHDRLTAEERDRDSDVIWLKIRKYRQGQLGSLQIVTLPNIFSES